MPIRFSANLGYLWADLPLPDAIRAAAMAGFDAVECHFPYDQPVDAVRVALTETGLPMLGLNTRPGDSFGLAALPGHEAEARAAIDEAIAYAVAVGARHVHVMAGKAEGTAARATFVVNLRHACAAAAPHGLGVVIEPINPFDVPGYFLRDSAQAIAIIDAVGADTLRLMFDCYHIARNGEDVIARLTALLPRIGHIQFAAVPDRGPPDHGDLDYSRVFSAIRDLGWTLPLGAEYRPGRETGDTLGWLTDARGL